MQPVGSEDVRIVVRLGPRSLGELLVKRGARLVADIDEQELLDTAVLHASSPVPVALRAMVGGGGRRAPLRVAGSSTLELEDGGDVLLVALDGSVEAVCRGGVNAPAVLELEVRAVGLDAVAGVLQKHLDGCDERIRRLEAALQTACEHLESATHQRRQPERQAEHAWRARVGIQRVHTRILFDGEELDPRRLERVEPARSSSNLPVHVVVTGGEDRPAALRTLASLGRSLLQSWCHVHVVGSTGIRFAVGGLSVGVDLEAFAALQREATGVLVVVPAGTELAPGVLPLLARAIEEGASVAYGDAVVDDEEGAGHWLPTGQVDPVLLKSAQTLGPILAFDLASLREVGGMPGWDWGAGWVAVLRLLGRRGEEALRRVPGLLGSVPSAALGPLDDELIAAVVMAARELFAAPVEIGAVEVLEHAPWPPALVRTHLEPWEAPRVSVVIVTHSAVGTLRALLEDLEATAYPYVETVIVAHRVEDPRMRVVLERARERGVGIVEDEGDFNFSRLVNRGVADVQSRYVCLLNDDVQLPDPRWLHELVALAQAEEAAAVGVRLLYPDGRIQHAGVAADEGVAGHLFVGRVGTDPCYQGRALVSSQLEVVTAAAVLVDREAFLEVGGFDEQFAVAYGDVDLCLRLRKAGRRVVLCATTELIHHESRTRGAEAGVQARALVASEEAALLRARHGWALAADPWLGPWVVPDAGRLRLRAGAGDLDPEHRCVRLGPYDFGQSAELVELRPGEPRALTLVLPVDLAPVELHGLVVRGWGVAPGASLEARVDAADGSVCLEPGWAPPGWLGAWVGTGPVALEAGGELVVQLGARGDRCLVRAVAGTAGMSGLEGAPRRSPLVELWVKPRAGH